MIKIRVFLVTIILLGFHDFISGQENKFEFIDGSVDTDSIFVISKKIIKKNINTSDSFFHIKTKGFGYIMWEHNPEIRIDETMTDCRISNDTIFIYNSNSRIFIWDRTIIKLNIKDSTYISHLNILSNNDLYKLKESESDFNKEIELHPIESSLYLYNNSCFANDSIISGYLNMRLPEYIYKQNKGDNTYWIYDVNYLKIRSKFECILFENFESIRLDID